MLAARARPRGDNAPPLVPVRFHYIIWGLSGAAVCLNPDCPRHTAHPVAAWSALCLEDRAHCLDCGLPLFPLATCVHCGQPYVVVARDDDGRWQQHADRAREDDGEAFLWLRWSGHVGDDADMEETADGQDDAAATAEVAKTWRFCLNDACRRILPGAGPATCCATPRTVRLTEIVPGQCPRCGGRKGPFPSVARRFRTGDDAATAVVAESLIRVQRVQDARKPAGGRRLLSFSDSRQRAAFFVPYLTRTSAESAIRADLYRVFQKLHTGASREGLPLSLQPERVARTVDFERLVGRYAEDGLAHPMQTVRRFDPTTHDDAYEVEDLRSYGPQARSRLWVTAAVTLLEEVCGSPRRTLRMLGAGLAGPEVFLTPAELDAFGEACPELACPAGGDMHDAVQILLAFLLRWTAVTMPEGVDLSQLLGGANLQAVYVALEERRSLPGAQVCRWNPYRARTSRPGGAVARSPLLSTLERLLELDRNRDAHRLQDLLDRFWGAMRDRQVVYAPGTEPHYQLRYERIVLRADRPFLRCGVCGAVTIHPYRGRCLVCGQGRLGALHAENVAAHRRARYTREPLGIVVREHTAQIDPDQGRSYQEGFRQGQVNVLSSSTTFELGIDVGQLKVVLLRNVPPSPSQYVQRAGRAGRRAEGAAFAVTYARATPHDQYHYYEPERFVQGRIDPPRPDMRNPVLAQRHAQSYLLARFLRQTDADEDQLHAGPFFAPGGLAEQGATWWVKQAEGLGGEVAAWLPSECLLQGASVVRRAAEQIRDVQARFGERLLPPGACWAPSSGTLCGAGSSRG